MQAYAKKLRPMEIGDIFDEVFDIYKKNFVLLAGISACIYLPLTLVEGLLLSKMLSGYQSVFADPSIGYAPEQIFQKLLSPELVSFVIVVFLGAMVVQPFATGALCYAIGQTYLNKRTTIKDALGFMVKRLGKYIGTILAWWLVLGAWYMLTGAIAGALIVFIFVMAEESIVVAIISLVPLLLALIVFWAILALWYVLTPAVFVTEGLAYFKALQRSKALMSGRKFLFKAALTLLLAVLLVVIVQQALQVPFGFVYGIPRSSLVFSPALSGLPYIFSGIVGSISQPILLGIVVLLYYDARIRKEGFDLQLLASEISSSAAESVSPDVPAGESISAWGTVLENKSPEPDLGTGEGNGT